MGYRLEGTFRRGNGKKVFTVFIILWVIISIVLIAPVSVSIVDATENGIFDFNTFLDDMLSKFLKDSDERQLDLKKNIDSKRGHSRKHY